MVALLSQKNCMTGCTMGTAKSANGTQQPKKEEKTSRVRSEPFHEISIRFRSDGMGKIAKLAVNFTLVQD
jgi:hypothetical protein